MRGERRTIPRVASEALLVMAVMLAAIGAIFGGLIFGTDGAVVGACLGAAFVFSAAALF